VNFTFTLVGVKAVVQGRNGGDKNEKEWVETEVVGHNWLALPQTALAAQS
jgi:hypothetical protein